MRVTDASKNPSYSCQTRPLKQRMKNKENPKGLCGKFLKKREKNGSFLSDGLHCDPIQQNKNLNGNLEAHSFEKFVLISNL